MVLESIFSCFVWFGVSYFCHYGLLFYTLLFLCLVYDWCLFHQPKAAQTAPKSSAQAASIAVRSPQGWIELELPG